MEKIHLARVDIRRVLDFERRGCKLCCFDIFIIRSSSISPVVGSEVGQGILELQVFVEVGFDVNVEIAGEVAEGLDLDCG